MSASFYEKGNVRVRTQIGPSPNIQCQVQLLDGQHLLISMDLPERSGAVAVRLSARVTGKEFEEVTGDGPTWLPKAVRDLLIKLITETTARIPRVREEPVKNAVAVCNQFVDVLEKVRASAIN